MVSHSLELYHFQPFSTDSQLCRKSLDLCFQHWMQTQHKVHDSNVTGDVLSSTKDALATLMNMCSQAKVIYILYPDVQQQRDNSSSNVCVYSLCEEKDPTNIAYSEVNLRSHLLVCLKR